MDALVHHMRRLADGGIRALAQHRTRPPKGAKALTRMHPWSEPRTLRESGGGPMPTFKIGARGHVPTTRRIESALEVTGFRDGHEETRVARRDGDATAIYPYGTYAAVQYRGAPVEPKPLEGAIVTAPGPMLEDVREELRSGAVETEHFAIIANVDEAFADEAAEIVEYELLDMVEPNEAGEDTGDGGPIVAKHRLDPPRERPTARRIITHRDRRRGRPRKKPKGDGSGRHGSDPAG